VPLVVPAEVPAKLDDVLTLQEIVSCVWPAVAYDVLVKDVPTAALAPEIKVVGTADTAPRSARPTTFVEVVPLLGWMKVTVSRRPPNVPGRRLPTEPVTLLFPFCWKVVPASSHLKTPVVEVPPYDPLTIPTVPVPPLPATNDAVKL
jgi:hypothetical protein